MGAFQLCTSDIRTSRSDTTTMTKSVFILFVSLIVAIHAFDFEWGNIEESCNISPSCKLEVEVYKNCMKLNGLNRKSPDPEEGPCITCPDKSRCCCNKDRDLDMDGTCRISQQCQWQLDSYNEYCQEEDMRNGQMFDSSLGCPDGSRCWCFM